MRIVLDAMGSDAFPEPEIQASLQAYDAYGDRIILVGDTTKLQPRLEALAGKNFPVELVNAKDMITMDDKGMQLALKARRSNSQTSMAVGMDLLKKGEADAFVTAGNTGGAMATAFYRLGLMENVNRPGLTALFPVKNGFCVVLDIGANPDCKPEHLLQFAIMGSIYAQKALKVERPKVGLISNGEEAGKGNQLVKDTIPLLENSNINYVGGIESKELFGGQVDVAVTDGFTGNVLLKSSEAVAKLLIDTLKQELTSNLITMFGAALAKPAFKRVNQLLDPAEYGAVPLLGLNGLVFIGHGRSDTRAMLSAIRATRQAVEVNLLKAIREAIQSQPDFISTTLKEPA